MKYYVYVDWTLEQQPRPFYVGKGSGSRSSRTRRNWKHRQTRIEFGLNRVIVFETEDESAALQQEIDLIAHHRTFVSDLNYNGIGCNFTGGGEGGCHPSENTRKLIAESNRRRRGEKRSADACQRIRDAIRKSIKRRGKWRLSVEHKRRIAEALKGHKVSSETRAKLSETTKRMHLNPILKAKIVAALHAAPRKSDGGMHCIAIIEFNENDVVINEHPTMNAAAKSAGLTVKYLRKAIRLDDQAYLLRRTGRKWKFKDKG